MPINYHLYVSTTNDESQCLHVKKTIYTKKIEMKKIGNR